MNILVTGARGFIGKNLIATLRNIQEHKDTTFSITEEITIFECDRNTDMEVFDMYCKKADFIYHLAGVNRPVDEEEFTTGNTMVTRNLVEKLKKYGNHCPIVLTSSIQAELDNPYGRSKKESEEAVFQYGEETGAQVYVYRLPNVFGKWCKPNYNSVIATFCHNIANDLPIQVNNPSTELSLVYVDDVVREFISLIKDNKHSKKQEFYNISMEHRVTLGEIQNLILEFKNSRDTKEVPEMTEGSFSKKLYATYLSYLPKEKFSYPLKMNVDERGSFTEILRTKDRGQFSVNISKPGITKGEHWHHTKNEKFVVVSGKGLIRFRKIDSDEIIDYHVSGEKIEVVDIPVGYTHNIINEGETDMVTFMWCNECFNPDRPDTYYLKVED